MITQLNPPLPMYIVSKNKTGLAHFVSDTGIENQLHWIIFLNDTGECWSVPNPDVRMEWNYTAGRRPE